MEIIEIKSLLSNNIDSLHKSIKWVESSLKFDEKEQVADKLRFSVNMLEKINKTIDDKPVAALFGRSQEGKSYLAKNILSEVSKPLMIKNGDEEYDFISDINPIGNKVESTGLVTRFTIDKVSDFPDFTVKVHLLSPKDVLLIILDSFYLDLKKLNVNLTKESIEGHILSYSNIGSRKKQAYFTEFHLFEVKSYFDKHFVNNRAMFNLLNETNFFSKIGKLLVYYSPGEWTNLLSVLWNEIPKFTELFNLLISGLESLEFSDISYIEFKQVLRKEGGILDVIQLKNLFSTNKVLANVKLANSSVKQIDKSLLAALIQELDLNITGDLAVNKPFLKDIDVLDFPGARTRLGMNYDDFISNQDTSITTDNFLRGKISYLFNKYTDDFSINNLLFCLSDSHIEVNEMPYLLSNWIDNNIGNDAGSRELTIQESNVPPLFIIMTFFNNQLVYDLNNDKDFESQNTNLIDRWAKRFIRIFEDGIVTSTKNWHKSWTSTYPNFQNFYLLRDYKYSTDTFKGFNNKGYEEDIVEDRRLFLLKLKESFVNFEFVKNHFQNPVEAWDSATTVNNDGSIRIIENLSKVANNKTKIQNNLKKISQIYSESTSLLQAHVFSTDLDNQRKAKMMKLGQYELELNAIIARKHGLFVDFIEFLLIKPREVFEVINNNQFDIDEVLNNRPDLSILYSTNPRLKDCQTQEDLVKTLSSHFQVDSKHELEEILNKQNIQFEDFVLTSNKVSKSTFYTDLIIENWKSSRLSFDKSSPISKFGLSNDFINFLLDHYVFLLENKKFKEKLVGILDNVMSNIAINNEYNEFLAESISLLLNELIVNFDLNYTSNEQISDGYKNTLANSNKFAQIEDIFKNENVKRDYSEIMQHKYYRWMSKLRESQNINAGTIQFDRANNQKLIDIINSFQSFNAL
jgi:hypothetical protein